MRFEATITAVLLALLAPASAAHGAGERARIVLVYDVEDGLRERCPPEGELVARVAAEIGYDPVDAEAPSSLEVNIALDEAGTALRGAWRLRRPDAEEPERSLRAAPTECDELVASLALSISVVLDRITRERVSPAVPPLPAPEAVPPKSLQVWTEPAAPSFDQPSDDAPVEEARRAHLILTLGAHAAAGTSPSVTAGVTGGVGFWLDPFSLRGEGRADLERSEIDEAGRGAAVQLYAASAVPCLHVGVAEACGVVTFGSLEASNIRLSGPPRESSFYAAAGLRPGLLIPFTPNWLLEVRGELVATFTPLELRSAGAEIWSLSPISGSLGTGFVVRYP